MKYIVYWILSWTAYVECPPQVDEFGRIINPGFSYNGCTEQRTKKLSKEFDDFQSATDFLKRALNEKSNGWQTESIDTVWMTTEQPVKLLEYTSGKIYPKHEHNIFCPKNCNILAGIVGLLLYGLLFSVSCAGQSPALLSFGAGSSYQFTYTDIPSAPSDGTSATLTFVSPGNILNTTGGDTQNKYLDGSWTTFRAFSLVGTESAYRRMINYDGDVVIGSSTNAFLFNQAGTGTTNYGIYGLSATAPMFFDSVGSLVPTAAIQSSAFATGPNADFQNIVNRSGGYLFFANTAGTLSGGDASTPTQSENNYGSINLSFARSFNTVSNKEPIYIGATTTNTYAIHSDLNIHNVLTHTSGWDAIQIGNATDFSLTKSTFVNAGISDVASQNALLQVSNAYGIVKDCIFLDAPQGMRISTHDLVFDNNYVRWNGNIANEVISYYGNYAASNRLMVTVDTVWITNSDFVSTTWTGAAFRVLDPDVIIVVKDCNFSGPTSLFQDDRISPTGSLIDGGGNSFGVSIPVPTFTNFTPTDFTGHGLLTEKYHHMKGRGYRTP